MVQRMVKLYIRVFFPVFKFEKFGKTPIFTRSTAERSPLVQDIPQAGLSSQEQQRLLGQELVSEGCRGI